MSSLLNNASLLLNPAGSTIAYKEDKIYSVLPTNGDGDFTFGGGAGGTRVNQDGYIERTPFNQFKYSNDLNTSPWSMNVTSGQTGKDGASDAWLLTKSTATTSDLYNALTIDGIQTFSIYVKKESSKGIKIYNFGDATQFVSINIETGANYQQSGAGVISYQAVAYNSDWWRVQVTMNCTNGKWYIYVTNGTSTQIADSITIQDAQLNAGDDVRPYQPTTDRLDYPRITYENGKGTLLQEPARTNINLFSTGPTGSFTTTGVTNQDGRYFYSQATLVNKTSLSPDGTNNAYEMELHAASYDMYTRFNGLTVGDNYVFSIHVKLGTARNFCVVVNNTSAWNTVTGSVFTSPELSDQHYTRVDIPFTVPSTGQVNVHLGGHSETMTQQDAGTVFLYGSQMEEGEFVSSYIPTTTAQVTRPQETFYKNDSPSLSSTSWTFYMSGVDIGRNKNSSGASIANVNWSFDSGNGPYGPNSLHNYNNTLYYYENTTPLATNLGSIGSTAQKIAVTKTGNTFKFFRNGILVNTSTPTLQGNTWDSFRMYGTTDAQGQAFSNNPSTIAIFQETLSDTDARELTTINSGSGGDTSYYGPYTIHTFTGSATFTPSFTGEVEVLVVAGGASGGVGSNGGGGGGAGGLLYASSYGVTQGTGITVTVGAGGAYRNGRGSGNNGSNSVFGGLTATGGGGGGGAGGGPSRGKDGGSGGGAQYNSYGGSGIPGQGNNGGDGNYYLGGNHDAGGGGGGAGGVGLSGSLSNAGNGGDGLSYSISGLSTYYAGGGGGSSNNVSSPGPHYPGEGGLGGGGKGGINGTTLLGTDGVDGFGGGGGAGVGASGGASGAGGDGIVIIRYLT